MKRILIFTCMVFVAVSVCFAAELAADGYNKTDNTKAQTVVTLTMDGTSDTNQEVIQLYFTATDPSEQAMPPTPATSVALGFNGDTIAENSDNSLYVWWKIVSGGNYDIQLGIDAPLVNTKDNATGQEIDWSASWTDSESTESDPGALTVADDNTVSSADDADYETITTHAGDTKLTTVGSREITITTDDVSALGNLTAGDYQAYLTLKIVADATGQAG